MVLLELLISVAVCMATCFAYFSLFSGSEELAREKERVKQLTRALEERVEQLERGSERATVREAVEVERMVEDSVHKAIAEFLTPLTKESLLHIAEEKEKAERLPAGATENSDGALADVPESILVAIRNDVSTAMGELEARVKAHVEALFTEHIQRAMADTVSRTQLEARLQETVAELGSVAESAAADAVRRRSETAPAAAMERETAAASEALAAATELKRKAEEEREKTRQQLERLKGESMLRVTAVEALMKEKLSRLEGEAEKREKEVSTTLAGIKSSVEGLSNTVSGLIDVMDSPPETSAVKSLQQQIEDTDSLILSTQEVVTKSRSGTLQTHEEVDVNHELQRFQLEKKAAERAIWSDISDCESEIDFPDDDTAEDSDLDDEHLRLFLDSKLNRRTLMPGCRISAGMQLASPRSQLSNETARAEPVEQRNEAGPDITLTPEKDSNEIIVEISATEENEEVEAERHNGDERDIKDEEEEEEVILRLRKGTNHLSVGGGSPGGNRWRRRTPSSRMNSSVIGSKFAELESMKAQGGRDRVIVRAEEESDSRAEKRTAFLQANHRSARFDRNQLNKDIALLDTAEEELLPAPVDKRLGLLANEQQRRDSQVGLNQAGLVLDKALSSKLMSSIRISLPYGGETTVQCFQDSPVTEIMDMLWSKLKAGITQCTELPASAQDFVDIVNMLLEENLLLAEALYTSAELGTKEAVLQQLVDLMHMNDGFKYIKAAIDKELLLFHENEHSLFRGNSFATVLISAYMRHHGHQYLSNTLGPVLRNVIEENRQLSSNTVSSQGSSRSANTLDQGDHPAGDVGPQPILAEDTIILTVSEILDAIDRSILSCPGPIKSLCRYTNEAVAKKYPGNELRIVAGFIFLRFFCPALVKTSSLLDGAAVAPQVSRGMIQVTKLLQLIVNTAGAHTEESGGALFHRYDQSQLLPLREKATRVLASLSNIYRGVPERPVASSGTKTRGLVNSLFRVLIQRLTVVLKALNEMASVAAFEGQATAIIGRLTAMLGYPLAAKKDYCLRVAGTDFYLPTGGFRPLIDNVGLQAYFRQSFVTCSTERGCSRGSCDFTDVQDGSKSPMLPGPAFALVEKVASKVEKRVALQIGCLIGDSHLPSWHFESAEVNDFRCKLIHRIVDQDVLLVHPPRILTGLCLDIMPDMMVIKVHLSQAQTSKTMEVPPMITAMMLLEQVCAKVRHVRLEPSAWMFKLGGKEQYIVQDVVLARLEYVSQCVKTGERPTFTLVKKSLLPFEKLERSVLKPKCVQISLDPSVDEPLQRGRASSSVLSVAELPLESRFTVCIQELFDVDFGDLDVAPGTEFFVVAAVYHGSVLISEEVETKKSPVPEWNETLDLGIFIISLPREARLCLTLYARNKKNGWQLPIGWISYRLFDFEGKLVSGKMGANLWPKGPANPIGSCSSNPSPDAPNILVVTFPSHDTLGSPVVFSEVTPATSPSSEGFSPSDLSESDALCLEYLLGTDQLYPLGVTEKELLWRCRDAIADKPHALPKVLQAVDWTDRAGVAEMYRLLALWAPISPYQALMLLDAKFEDKRVRRHAAKVLGNLSDDELEDFLLQLVQVLKHEPYHYSALAKFLVGRALRSPQQIGQKLFWLLFAELRSEEAHERYGLMLEAYLRGCGGQRELLLQQIDFVHKATDLSFAARDKTRVFALALDLRKASLPSGFALPYDSTVIAAEVVPQECKVMDSFQKPLLLSFSNKDSFAEHVRVLVKTGDDLRQDVLTLQMFKIMQKLWISEGLDLRMSAYHCMSTGPNVGLIEVVNDATTTASIQSKAAGVRGAFIEQTLYKWLAERNSSEAEMERARENFIRSCAGYCIATYVLGIGDRHNDNIMLTSNGHLFHIDFGHFLGNVQKWKGFKRDRSPFVFTPEFAYVMGGKNSPGFERFVDYCCRGYNILRKYSDLFITLFALMLSTGMPELKCKEDIEYLREAFSVESTDAEASALFRKLIHKALNTTATRLNNALHLAAQQLRNN